MFRSYKVKKSHNTPMEAQGGGTYSSYSFTTSALDGVSGPFSLIIQA
jgi:hypothetical protein